MLNLKEAALTSAVKSTALAFLSLTLLRSSSSVGCRKEPISDSVNCERVFNRVSSFYCFFPAFFPPSPFMFLHFSGIIQGIPSACRLCWVYEKLKCFAVCIILLWQIGMGVQQGNMVEHPKSKSTQPGSQSR